MIESASSATLHSGCTPRVRAVQQLKKLHARAESAAGRAAAAGRLAAEHALQNSIEQHELRSASGARPTGKQPFGALRNPEWLLCDSHVIGCTTPIRGTDVSGRSL